MAEPNPLLDFPDTAICVAVDTSGSTAGSTSKSSSKLLGQFAACGNKLLSLPQDVPGLLSVKAGGGTDPSCLYSNREYLHHLRKSDLWFLFTDGQITNKIVRNSPKPLPRMDFMEFLGYATFALAPNSVILSHDLRTHTLNLMQAKGCFERLLQPGMQQLLLTEDITWDQLPLIQYADFVKIKINAPQTVSDEEFLLNDGTKFRLDDLYKNSLSPAVSALALRPKNLKSIVMSENLRGRGNQVDAWLTTQQSPAPPKPVDLPDLKGSGRNGVTALVIALQRKVATDDRLEQLRTNLRAAHEDNWNQLLKIMNDHRIRAEAVHTSNTSVATASRHSQSIKTTRSSKKPRMTSAKFLGQDIMADSGESAGQSDMDWTSVSAPSQSEPDTQLSIRNKRTSEVPVKPQTPYPDIDDCVLPGFKRLPVDSRAESEFVGKCQLCHRISVLAILISSQYDENDFGAADSLLPFPTEPPAFNLDDIAIERILSSIVCDACAPHVVRGGVTQHGEKICVAIALVSANHNQAAWLNVLNMVFRSAVKPDDVFKGFLAVLKSGRTAGFLTSVTENEENIQWIEAVKWMRGDLEKFVGGAKSI